MCSLLPDRAVFVERPANLAKSAYDLYFNVTMRLARLGGPADRAVGVELRPDGTVSLRVSVFLLGTATSGLALKASPADLRASDIVFGFGLLCGVFGVGV